MKKEIDQLKNTTYIIVFLWVLTIIFTDSVMNSRNKYRDLARSQGETIESYLEGYNTEKESFQTQAQINLILREYISGKQERELQKDSTYRHLINKL